MANLTSLFEDYVPFGLEAGLVDDTRSSAVVDAKESTMTIRNDATRLRIVTKDKRRPRAVVARQGQVLLDTDFDQQSRHQPRAHRDRDAGLAGLARPARRAGRQQRLQDHAGRRAPANFDIGAGPRLSRPAGCSRIPPSASSARSRIRAPATPSACRAIIAIKALIRHIDPVEEPVLADVALGDAQASGRALVDWQVFPLPSRRRHDHLPTVADRARNGPALIAPSTGTLAVIAAGGGAVHRSLLAHAGRRLHPAREPAVPRRGAWRHVKAGSPDHRRAAVRPARPQAQALAPQRQHDGAHHSHRRRRDHRRAAGARSAQLVRARAVRRDRLDP